MSITERRQDLADSYEAAVLPPPMPNLKTVDHAPGTLVHRELRCTGCGYGAVASLLPEQCPMCAATDWDFVDWRPFTSA
jgi:rubrerythrin